MSGLQGGFFASLVFGTINDAEKTGVVRQCNVLFLAATPDEALTKARTMGVDRSSDAEKFLGVEELLSIDDEIQDGVELVWREGLWMEEDIGEFLERNMHRASFAREIAPSPVNWYVGELVLLEVIEGSAKEEDSLIWRNTYLLNESDGQLALQRLEVMGRQEQDAGAHTSDGHNAMWRFLGVSMLRPVEELPADGSLLWCELRPTQTGQHMPSRDELGVFRWLNRVNAKG